nr:TonB-dependent receptor [Candidatus Eremiobacteraeota bacterium]
EQHFTKKFRMTAGICGDLFHFRVKSLRPENSGDVSAGLISPKISFAYETSPKSEIYLNLGESYHNNDGRGVTERVDPATGSRIDPGSGFIIEGATPLVRALGQEVGLRYALSSKLRTTVSFWNLDLGSELVFSGDAGTTSPGRPSQRSGVELANFYVPSPGVTIDADLSTSSARVTNFDRVGQHIPGSLQTVATFGRTVDRPRSFGSLRMRYFGPRPLIEDASVFSKPTTTVSLQAGIRPTKDSRLSLDVFNVLNTKASDIDYSYNSSLPSDPPSTLPTNGGAGVADIHFHPIEKRLLRLTFSKAF